MGWTEERIARLKELWEAGHSAQRISEILGDVSRNAVIGKVHRLGLAGRATPSRPVKRPPREAQVEAVVRGLTYQIFYSFSDDKAVAKSSKPKIHRPPGGFLLSLSRFIYPKRMFERIFEPTISDMREEFYQALSEGKVWKAKYIVVRGHVAVFNAAGLQVPVSLLRLIGAIWRIGS
ncbi:MAG TPA: GcrA family cell cycle regulator [Hyphomonadaceae bacterium]|jgi:hypothetical protein|nr:GcrA family cell cycle regulator [Hyphomonadaceae bacterium]